MSAPVIVLYSTSSAATLQLRTAISRIKLILDVKGVQYEEVRLRGWGLAPGGAAGTDQGETIGGGAAAGASRPWLRAGREQPGLHPVQVDLSMEPQRREQMVASSGGVRLLPQLHVNGTYLGTAGM